MQSPNVPNYVTTQRYPVARIGHLRTEPTFENIIAHQSYLEKLQFEQNSVRCWSNAIQDQIMRKTNRVYAQLGGMMLTMEQRKSIKGWTRAHAEQRMQQPPSAQTPRLVQPPPAPSAQQAQLQVKPAPPRPQGQPAASSMSGAAVNAPFPAEMGADPWMQGLNRGPL